MQAHNRRGRVARSGLLAAAVTGLAGLTAALTVGAAPILDADAAARRLVEPHDPGWVQPAAQAVNWIGQGWLLVSGCLAVAAFMAVRRHTIGPLVTVATAALLAPAAVVVVKVLSDRAAPHAVAVLAAAPFGSGGASYPSGHVTNAVVWFGVLVRLLAVTGCGVVLLRVIPPALTMATTVFLGYHWLTDAVAGLLLGVIVDQAAARMSSAVLPAAGGR